MFKVIHSAFLSLLLVLSQPIFAETEEDPWEGFNRSMFSFNTALDNAIVKPVAKGYDWITPNFVQKGVSNFFSNLGEVSNVTNNFLQAKFVGTVASTGRFLINSTIGIFGLFDVASALGINEYDEDFGQTLGYWGVSSGPYLMLPFFGPSTVRDGTGLVVEYFYEEEIDLLHLTLEEEIALLALDVVQTRVHLFSVESLIIGDSYSFIRDVYLQNRAYAVNDGAPAPKKTKKDISLDDGDSWGEESEDDSWGDETEDDSWGDEEVEDSWGDEVEEDSWGDE
ncbi:MlaA family lipoprotein [Marinomonas colpomeniae]|uniref:VacJ family lipoprotein n=1 Tax=Marinomonas colpomeniae TaxID=2774408 RepID=A0ABR8P120_9GAMM|nr:VacJ family lipoprotein [Marinomonas colpomeniae]MBD5771868.1 VacJ family lipoprotein [Marinomonas colpomeniae]